MKNSGEHKRNSAGLEVGEDEADLVVGDLFVELEEEGFEAIGGELTVDGLDLLIGGFGNPGGDGGGAMGRDEVGEVFGDGGTGAGDLLGDFFDACAPLEHLEGLLFLSGGDGGARRCARAA